MENTPQRIEGQGTYPLEPDRTTTADDKAPLTVTQYMEGDSSGHEISVEKRQTQRAKHKRRSGRTGSQTTEREARAPRHLSKRSECSTAVQHYTGQSPQQGQEERGAIALVAIPCTFIAKTLHFYCKQYCTLIAAELRFCLASISPISRQYLASISPVSRWYLASISPVSCFHLANILLVSRQYLASISPLSRFYPIFVAKVSRFYPGFIAILQLHCNKSAILLHLKCN